MLRYWLDVCIHRASTAPQLTQSKFMARMRRCLNGICNTTQVFACTKQTDCLLWECEYATLSKIIT